MQVGPVNFASAVNDTSVGGSLAWSLPANALLTEGGFQVYATSGSARTNRLRLTDASAGLGGIGDEDSVTEIVIGVKRVPSFATVHDIEAKLVLAGAVQSDNQAKPGPWVASETEEEYTFAVAFTGAQVKASDFGFVLSAGSTGGSFTVHVNHIRLLSVTHEPPVTPTNDVAENLIAFLLDDEDIAELVGTRVGQDKIPQPKATPYIWLQQAGVNYETCTDAEHGEEPVDWLFDIESVSDDVDEAAELAGMVRRRLHAYRGDFGDSTVQAVLVEDHEDDYIPRNEFEDAGLHAATFRAAVSP